MATILQELLPGLPNDVTLTHIATKVEWTSIYVLSQVNHAWAQAIQGRLVHNARVRSHSTETFDVMYCSTPYLLLCNRKDCRPRPILRGHFETQFVALDGRVYSFGLWIGTVIEERCVRLSYESAAVLVIDLAGRSNWWKPCAPMHAVRSAFVCGVKDGKLCVVGGWNGDGHVNTEEVYDPNTNSWSSKSIPDEWHRGFQFQGSLEL